MREIWMYIKIKILKTIETIEVKKSKQNECYEKERKKSYRK